MAEVDDQTQIARAGNLAAIESARWRVVVNHLDTL
jgi:hypothetical protein